MDEDTRRNMLFIAIVGLLAACGLLGATLGGYVDWGQTWHTMQTARSSAEDPDLLWVRAQEFYEDAGRDPKMAALAKACARRVIILNPRHNPARKMVAAMCLQDKDWSEAQTQCQAVLDLDPTDLTARLGLGAALRGLKKNLEARDAYRAVWNDSKASSLQKEEAQRNLREIDPDFVPVPTALLLPAPVPSPLESPSSLSREREITPGTAPSPAVVR